MRELTNYQRENWRIGICRRRPLYKDLLFDKCFRFRGAGLVRYDTSWIDGRVLFLNCLRLELPPPWVYLV